MGDGERGRVEAAERPVSKAAERYDAYMAAFVNYHAEYPEQREGQAHFNVLFFGGHDPDFANEIRGGPLDPFYVDARLPSYFDALRAHWGLDTDEPQGSSPSTSSAPAVSPLNLDPAEMLESSLASARSHVGNPNAPHADWMCMFSIGQTEAILARVRALEAVTQAARDYEDCADWYRRCLEGIIDRATVRGLAEARVGFDSARDTLRSALAVVDGGGHDGQ